MEVKVHLDRLKGGHFILCVLLVAGLVSCSLCLAVFTAKNNEIQNENPFFCPLFVDSNGDHPSYSICQFVIGGSALVLVMIVVFLVEAVFVVLTTCTFRK